MCILVDVVHTNDDGSRGIPFYFFIFSYEFRAWNFYCGKYCTTIVLGR